MNLNKQVFIIQVTFRLPAFRQVEKNIWKNSGDFIACMSTKYYNHWICGWVVMATDGKISVILVIFWPFYSFKDGKNKIFQKNKQKQRKKKKRKMWR